MKFKPKTLDQSYIIVNPEISPDLPYLWDTHSLAISLGVPPKDLGFLFSMQKQSAYRDVKRFIFKNKSLPNGKLEDKIIKTLRRSSLGYDYFFIPKNNGKGRRLITNPKPKLRKIQKAINDQILSKLPIHSMALAYRNKEDMPEDWTWQKGVFAAAGNKHVMGEADIKSYFTSITTQHVINLLMRHTNYNKEVCWALAKCCTDMGVVQQGSLTGPIISNIIMYDVDERITQRLAERGWTVGRYSDNYMFGKNWDSSENPWEENFDIESAMQYPLDVIKEELLKEGFKLNEQKCWVAPNAEAKPIMNLSLHVKLNIPKRTYYQLKASVHNFSVKKRVPELFKNDLETYFRILRGKLNYWQKINPKIKPLQDLLLQTDPTCMNPADYTALPRWNNQWERTRIQRIKLDKMEKKFNE